MEILKQLNLNRIKLVDYDLRDMGMRLVLIDMNYSKKESFDVDIFGVIKDGKKWEFACVGFWVVSANYAWFRKQLDEAIEFYNLLIHTEWEKYIDSFNG